MYKFFVKDCNSILIAVFIIIFFKNGNSQQIHVGNLQGIVLDVTNDKPLEKALVRIIVNSYSDVTNNNGLFSIPNLEFAEYTLEVSYLGYKNHSQRIKVDKEIIKGIIIHLYPISLETSAIVITGTHEDTQFDDMDEFINVIKGKELEREIGLTIASTLKNETGLSIRSMGPAPARPVIRGLGNDRIQITEDGIQSTDLSSTSPDHAVAIEPFTIDRIEVIRGPKILTQNSTTIGGIVNIIREEIPQKIPGSINGVFGIYGVTVYQGYLGSGVVHIPLNNFVVRGEYSRRKTDDINTPSGTLKNSDISIENFSTGIGMIENNFNTGISLRQYSSEYGIPGGFVGAHPNGVDIKIFKRQINFKTKISIGNSHFNELKLDFARDYFRQTEYERADLIGAEFTIFNYRGQIDLSNKSLWIFSGGNSGLSFEYRDFKVGGFVFTPPTNSFKTSLYSYQGFTFGKALFEGSIRVSYDKLIPSKENLRTDVPSPETRSFITYSLSASLHYPIAKNIVLGVTLSRSSRVPTIEELYSEGPHLAAYSYEIGNPELKDERGVGAEIFVSFKNEIFSSVLTLFANELDYYIIPRNSGRINFQTLLPVYQTEGIAASFRGVEFSNELEFLNGFFLNTTSSFTYGKIKNTPSPLPQIPPFKTNIELRYTKDNIGIGLNSELAASQKRVDIFEFPTAGYIIYGGYIQYSFITGPLVNNISFVAENIFNKEYRNHLSRVKVILPESGRNFRLTFKMFF